MISRGQMSKAILTIAVASAASLLLASSLARAEKMNAEIHNVVIEKLERAIKQGKNDETVNLAPVRSRLADLYADRARLKAMDEAERGCSNCTGALQDRRKALSLYDVVLVEASKESRGQILLQMAQLHDLNGDSKASESIYEKIVSEGSSKHSKEVLAESLIGRAEARFGRGDINKALVDFEAAYELVGPGRKGQVQQRIAWCHLNKGDQPRAVKTLVRVLQTPGLLVRESSEGIQYDPSFQEDVAKDLATFMARGSVARKDLDLLESLAPERAKRDVLRHMAGECERLGQKQAAIDAWIVVLRYEKRPSEQLEAMVRITQIRFDLGQKKETLTSLKETFDLWSEVGCKGEECANHKLRLRGIVTAWNKLEKQQPSALLAEAYLTYLAHFEDDIEMTLWAAEVYRAQKKHREAGGLYNRAANASLKSKAKNSRAWLENGTVGEVEMAELIKDLRTREIAYEHYLTLNPNGAIAAKIRYQRAHIAYERGDMAEASNRFYLLVSSKQCRGQVSADVMTLCSKAADLDLDALVGLKDHMAVQVRATEYSRLLPSRKNEYLKISRTAVMKQAEAMEPNQALVKLGEADLTGASTEERVRFLKMRIAFAEKSRNVAETKKSADLLLKTDGLSADDREFALGKLAWAAEMNLDFDTAYSVTSKMKLADLRPDQRAFKLAVFAELAGRDPRTHIEDFLKASKDKTQVAQMRARLIRTAKNPGAMLAKYENEFKHQPGLYASLALQVYAETGDEKFASKALKVKGVAVEPEGKVLARELMIKEFVAFEAELTKHRLATSSEALIQKTLTARLKLIAHGEKLANRAIASKDWAMQLLTLSLLAGQDRRLHDEIVALPVPSKLKGHEREAYIEAVNMNARGYLAKSEQIAKKIDLLWGEEDEEKTMVADMQSARKEIRPVLASELRRLAAIAPNAIRAQLQEELKSEPVRPSDRDVQVARRDAQTQPFNSQALTRLRDLENDRGHETMVAYLDARIMKLAKATERK